MCLRCVALIDVTPTATAIEGVRGTSTEVLFLSTESVARLEFESARETLFSSRCRTKGSVLESAKSEDPDRVA